MSDEKQEVAPVVSLIDQLKMQHASFVFQRDQANVNLQQLVGAIYACEVMIKKHEEEARKELPKEDEKEELSDAA